MTGPVPRWRGRCRAWARGVPASPWRDSGAILSHKYHEVANPFEFLYRLHPSLASGARVAIIDVDKRTQDHGTPPPLLRCELAAIGYRQVDFTVPAPADGYLAVFVPASVLLPVLSIKPCKQ